MAATSTSASYVDIEVPGTEVAVDRMLEVDAREKPKEGTCHKQGHARDLGVVEMECESSTEFGKASASVIQGCETCSTLNTRNRQMKNKVQSLQEKLKIARRHLFLSRRKGKF